MNKLSIGTWLTIYSEAIAEIMSSSGYDWVTIDLEHTPISLSQAEKLKKEIEFFCGNKYPVDLFPEWETLPYDNFSPLKVILLIIVGIFFMPFSWPIFGMIFYKIFRRQTQHPPPPRNIEELPEGL